MTIKKKKSLVGWTYKNWEQGFEQYSFEIVIPHIVKNKNYWRKHRAQVRITIQEI